MGCGYAVWYPAAKDAAFTPGTKVRKALEALFAATPARLRAQSMSKGVPVVSGKFLWNNCIKAAGPRAG